MEFWKDGLKTLSILAAATLLNYAVMWLTDSPYNVAIIYLLGIMLTARFTKGYFWGIAAAVSSIGCINFFFTYPFMALNFFLQGYPIAFIVMLSVALLTSTMMTNIRKHQDLVIETEKEKTRANLLRAVSHDLRTPLTSIIGSSATLLENRNMLDEEEQNEMLGQIHEDANWLLHMVENLLSVTRIHDDQVKVTKVSEPVEEVVSEAVARLKKRYPQAQIDVTVPVEFLMVPMDATLIEQVIINLLENAVKYSGSKKPVGLSVEKNGSAAVFHVRDYGVGLSSTQMETLFDGLSNPQGNSVDKTKGMGIGLSICQTIIHAHGGGLKAVNHSEGVEFIFTLPLEGGTTV